jgi:hypothetical protein
MFILMLAIKALPELKKDQMLMDSIEISLQQIIEIAGCGPLPKIKGREEYAV